MLLSTSIIESGLDIPRANTIFIDQPIGSGSPTCTSSGDGWAATGTRPTPTFCTIRSIRPGATRPCAQGARGIDRPGSGLCHRHARPGDPGSRKHPRRPAVGPHRRGGLRHVLPAPQGGCRGPVRPRPPLPEEEDVELDLGVPAFIPADFIAEEELRLEALRSMQQAGSPGGRRGCPGGTDRPFRHAPAAGPGPGPAFPGAQTAPGCRDPGASVRP